MNALWHERYISVENTKLRILDANRDAESSLVLWCGLGATAEQFTPLISKLNSVHIVAVDPPGHGCSDPWDGAFDERSVQAVWEAVLEQFDGRNIWVGGHSYGACSTLMGTLLQERPIEGVILLDGGYMGPFEQEVDQVRLQCEGFIDENSHRDWEHVFAAAREEVKIWNDDVEFAYRSMMKEHNGMIIPRVDVQSSIQASLLINQFSASKVQPSPLPVLLLRATEPKDFNEVREAATRELATRLINLKVVEVPASGHDVLNDNLEFVVNQMTCFMSL